MGLTEDRKRLSDDDLRAMREAFQAVIAEVPLDSRDGTWYFVRNDATEFFAKVALFDEAKRGNLAALEKERGGR